jgi:hypothetical protein
MVFEKARVLVCNSGDGWAVGQLVVLIGIELVM